MIPHRPSTSASASASKYKCIVLLLSILHVEVIPSVGAFGVSSFPPNASHKLDMPSSFISSSTTLTSTTSRNLFRRKKSSVAEVQVDADVAVKEEADDDEEEDLETISPDMYDEKDKKAKTKTETLRFGGRMSYTSQPLPLPEDIDTLVQFMKHPDHQYILLCGAEKDSHVEFIPTHDLTSDFLSHWKLQADRVHASHPNLQRGDCVAKVQPAKIQIWTVQVCPESTVGISLVCDNDNDSDKEGTSSTITEMSTLSSPSSKTTTTSSSSWEKNVPQYQAILIDDEPRAEGPSILVWLFDKIVHGSKRKHKHENNNGKERQTAQSGSGNRNEVALLRVSARPVEMDNDSDNDNFTFTAESEMWLEFQFPKWLLSFFPMKREMAEQISGDAIVKALEMNLIPAIDRLCDAYLAKCACTTMNMVEQGHENESDPN